MTFEEAKKLISGDKLLVTKGIKYTPDNMPEFIIYKNEIFTFQQLLFGMLIIVYEHNYAIPIESVEAFYQVKDTIQKSYEMLLKKHT